MAKQLFKVSKIFNAILVAESSRYGILKENVNTQTNLNLKNLLEELNEIGSSMGFKYKASIRRLTEADTEPLGTSLEKGEVIEIKRLSDTGNDAIVGKTVVDTDLSPKEVSKEVSKDDFSGDLKAEPVPVDSEKAAIKCMVKTQKQQETFNEEDDYSDLDNDLEVDEENDEDNLMADPIKTEDITEDRIEEMQGTDLSDLDDGEIEADGSEVDSPEELGTDEAEDTFESIREMVEKIDHELDSTNKSNATTDKTTKEVGSDDDTLGIDEVETIGEDIDIEDEEDLGIEQEKDKIGKPVTKPAPAVTELVSETASRLFGKWYARQKSREGILVENTLFRSKMTIKALLKALNEDAEEGVSFKANIKSLDADDYSETEDLIADDPKKVELVKQDSDGEEEVIEKAVIDTDDTAKNVAAELQDDETVDQVDTKSEPSDIDPEEKDPEAIVEGWLSENQEIEDPEIVEDDSEPAPEVEGAIETEEEPETDEYSDLDLDDDSEVVEENDMPQPEVEEDPADPEIGEEDANDQPYEGEPESTDKVVDSVSEDASGAKVPEASASLVTIDGKGTSKPKEEKEERADTPEVDDVTLEELDLDELDPESTEGETPEETPEEEVVLGSDGEEEVAPDVASEETPEEETSEEELIEQTLLHERWIFKV